MASTFTILQQGKIEEKIRLIIIMEKKLGDPQNLVQVEGYADFDTQRYYFREIYSIGTENRATYIDLDKSYLSYKGKPFSGKIQLAIMNGYNIIMDNTFYYKVGYDKVQYDNEIYVGYE